MRFRLSCLSVGLMGAMWSGLAFAEDTLDHIEPQNARKHINRQVEVVFEVKHAKYSLKRNTVFLDSEVDFQDPKNLGVRIPEAGLAAIKRVRSIDKPSDFYQGKRIRVVGKVILQDDKPYIDVTDAEQLDIAPLDATP